MNAKVYLRTLSGASLTRLLAVLRPMMPFAILQRVDNVDFPASDSPLLPVNWPIGRSFGSELEVRWEARGKRFHTLLTCTQAPSTRWSEALDLNDYDESECSYFLWGPGDVALGRSLRYGALSMPDGRAYRPQLLVAEYYDPNDGRLVFTRHVNMHSENTA